ncbi:hypothetical protein [Streptomyces sp. DH12]|uniref:hypothetical protein n=1 Tax=Streptomyces sp. DH12 TaxID=2857010 RepID=UPI001E43B830|nr:hypothetical protein [Streptomyces sp. DH12]
MRVPEAGGGRCRPGGARGARAGRRGPVGTGGGWRALAGAVLLAAVTAGCGIRTTSVPVDAGGAPSRVPCSLSEAAAGSRPPDGGTTARVYLVCASGLEAVDRTLPTGGSATGGAGAVAVAQALLEAMRERPSQSERQAGFTTYVEEPLTVSAGREGDPPGALRLSRQPEDLPPAALAQIVCTYAGTDATSVGGTVVLGGPGKYPVRRYVCNEGVKERPESAVPTHSP